MIKIYKCIKFPNKWIFYKKLFRSKSVDHIIFKSGKFWYLFNNEKIFRKVYSKLVGYVSQNPLSNKWKRINILKISFYFTEMLDILRIKRTVIGFVNHIYLVDTALEYL